MIAEGFLTLRWGASRVHAELALWRGVNDVPLYREANHSLVVDAIENVSAITAAKMHQMLATWYGAGSWGRGNHADMMGMDIQEDNPQAMVP